MRAGVVDEIGDVEPEDPPRRPLGQRLRIEERGILLGGQHLVARAGVHRIPFDRFAVARQRLVEASHELEKVAALQVGIGAGGSQGNGARVGGVGQGEVADLLGAIAELHPDAGVGRSPLQMVAIACHRLGPGAAVTQRIAAPDVRPGGRRDAPEVLKAAQDQNIISDQPADASLASAMRDPASRGNPFGRSNRIGQRSPTVIATCKAPWRSRGQR